MEALADTFGLVLHANPWPAWPALPEIPRHEAKRGPGTRATRGSMSTYRIQNRRR